MVNWLQNAADVVAIATALVSWHGFFGLALAVIVWLPIDWRKVYGIFDLGTQMDRLHHEQSILISEILPVNYRRLTPATVIWANSAILRWVFFVLTASHSHSFYLVSAMRFTTVTLNT
jgi:hypothetical protein